MTSVGPKIPVPQLRVLVILSGGATVGKAGIPDPFNKEGSGRLLGTGVSDPGTHIALGRVTLGRHPHASEDDDAAPHALLDATIASVAFFCCYSVAYSDSWTLAGVRPAQRRGARFRLGADFRGSGGVGRDRTAHADRRGRTVPDRPGAGRHRSPALHAARIPPSRGHRLDRERRPLDSHPHESRADPALCGGGLSRFLRVDDADDGLDAIDRARAAHDARSEEHTSELQSH